jgi:hypothetical protein
LPRPLLRWLACAALALGPACGRTERAPEAPLAALPPAPDSGLDSDHDGAVPADDTKKEERVPDDIPIPTGLRSLSVTSMEPGSLVALYTGELEPEEVAKGFADGLKRTGWSIDESRSTGSDLGLLARKDQRMASVVVTRLSGRLHVELGVWAPRP